MVELAAPQAQVPQCAVNEVPAGESDGHALVPVIPETANRLPRRQPAGPLSLRELKISAVPACLTVVSIRAWRSSEPADVPPVTSRPDDRSSIRPDDCGGRVWHAMFVEQIPLTEKILRTALNPAASSC